MSSIAAMAAQLAKAPPALAGGAENITEFLRTHLKSVGSADTKQLAEAAGLKSRSVVGALLSNDIKRGQISVEDGLYRWNDDFDEKKHKQIAQAIKLLRKAGYRVEKAAGK